MSAQGWPARAAVIGVGTMGTGFAQLLALAGIETTVADAAPELARAGAERAVELARRFEGDGLMPPGSAEAIEQRVTHASSIEEAVAGAGFVIEAVREDAEVKRDAFRRIAAAAPADAVVASNTSAIPIRELATAFDDGTRFLGTHWFNPPQWVPSVEVIPGPSTAPEVIERVHGLLRRLGKRPATVGDAAGFVANRIQFAMFKEAASIVDDGVATAEEVDEVVRASFGFRLPFFGPFRIADMAGLDVYEGAYRALESDLGERFSIPPSVAELVARGRLGTKSGGGYSDVPADVLPELVAWRDRAYVELSALLDRLEREAPATKKDGEA
ncbi:MAG TPA: 3-hydroxyacyl-CoA dehydrogenase family protein [Baekduia sp.]|nr:3-hydroxyacyl-CoA dehydrogenase family protein [Baekduia sp.]